MASQSSPVVYIFFDPIPRLIALQDLKKFHKRGYLLRDLSTINSMRALPKYRNSGAIGINDLGQIVGSYWDGLVSRGFLATPAQKVSKDYDGDGKTDVAVWRSDSGVWFIQKSSDGGILFPQWGLGALGDIPIKSRY